MRVNVEALRQQMWRAASLFEALHRYALSIGCDVIHDEIICDTAEKERLLANWWKDNT